MDRVSIRDMRNKGGDVIDRVEHGETLVVTRDGRPVAELRPFRARGVPRDLLVERARYLPPVDHERFRADVDAFIDPYIDMSADPWHE